MHISSGITFVKSSTPVNVICERAEELLEVAKSEGKDRVCMFNRVVQWKDLRDLLRIRDRIEGLFESDVFSKSMLYRLNEILEMAEKESKLIEDKKIEIKDVYNLKWRPMLSYLFARNIKIKEEGKESTEDLILEFVKLVEKYRGDLIIPLWQILYAHRRYS